jgi:mono/diheme cytochrome c family protein
MLHRQPVIRGLATAALSATALWAAATHRADAQAQTSPTFARDVAPIVYANCAVCHRPGQAAPFPLLTYDDVKKRGALIVSVTKRRYMPPWHATPAPGFPEFRDERRLSDADVATLERWVDTGMAAGDLAQAPRPPVFPSGWTLGEPDVVLTFSRAIDVPADGPDLYRNIVLPLDLPADQWITAIDYEPSARKAVHHALFFLAPASEVASIGENDILPGISARSLLGGRGRGGRGGGRGGGAAGIGGWVPGMTPRFFPEGVAQSLPAHTSVVAQLHLHPSGKAEHEEGRVGIYFAKQRPAKSLTSIQVPPTFGFAMGIDIPAGERRYTIRDSLVLPVDVEALGARGHAHYLAKDMKMTATLPDGSTKGLLSIGDWDFGWQDSYFYKTPIVLPKGTRLDVEISYDNSADNPRNPNTPPRRVLWGLGSFDEMGSMTLLAAAPAGPDRAALREAQAAHFREQLIERFSRRR